MSYTNNTFEIGIWGRGMISRHFSILLAFVFLILISTIVSAGQEIRITSYGERGFNPAIYDDKVVWTDDIFSGNIYMRDLSTGKKKKITDQPCSLPAIYGDRIVWVRSGSIYLYNISSGTETRIATADSANRRQIEYLGIYGDKVVWEDNRNRNYSSENWNIYVYDLSTSRETRITSTPIDSTFATEVAIYGDKTVWRGDCIDNENRVNDIYMYDLSTSTQTQITTNGSAWDLEIYEDRIAYTDSRSGRPNIYLYNISTSTEIQITTSGSDYSISGIYGDRIVWQDNRNGNWDIYMYDLSTSMETQLTTDKSDQKKPAIYGDRIVWQDYRNTDPNEYYCEIYMYDFSDKPVVPFASFTNNVTSGSGNVPLTVLFTDTSTGGEPASWYWDFGDGITSKHAQTATHTFTKTGTYNVSLTVTNSAGSSTVKKSDCITVTPPQAPVADFFSPRVEQVKSFGGGVFVNETLLFMDNSTGSPTSWFWDFGDGAASTAQNPAHTYNAMGGYTVNLTVTNSIGGSTKGTYGYVLVGIIDESASPAHFSSNITNGSAPLTVIFHDDDADIIDPIWREWDFGDGVTQFYRVDYNESATPYATHTYEKPGKYTVTLYLDNRGGKSIITKYNYITVTGPNVPLADFSANVISGRAPLVVLFTDTSTGQAPTSWLWDFGDGIHSKHAMNATHTFTNPGIYDVTLTVSGKAGNNKIKKSNYINVTA